MPTKPALPSYSLISSSLSHGINGLSPANFLAMFPNILQIKNYLHLNDPQNGSDEKDDS